MPQTTTITATSHPTLFEACETISHDAGAQAGWPSHTVPAGDLDAIEAALATLTADELDEFCVGDADEMEITAARSPGLSEAHQLLGEFFENYLPRPPLPEDTQ
ncbi:hypothetical protein ACIU1J_27460 [Azospirillum doebereinerae]|uniref:hypothetical protein n=1 Tax=Azospirillum doebereinerae TaxID=92933 RepID=UPI001EE54DDF|nr:hypothetical protein [Azospirillum doebereinerae]MCG5241358.1 hypothetical protein [Azospirillum doebereinerae]